jgi:hypothetical protein
MQIYKYFILGDSMLQKISKKLLLAFLICMVSITSFANCFGKFALLKKAHGLMEGITIGGNIWVAKVFKTLILYVALFFLYSTAFFIDFVILNLIEFWTDSNPLAANEFDKDGKLVKTATKADEKVTLTYSEFGKKLTVDTIKGKDSSQFILFKNQPGKMFTETNGKLEEINLSSKTIGDKVLLKLAINGKLESSKVVDQKEVKAVEEKLSTQF